ncbi:MAG: aminotransferase class I/II-fold pyridoxal phosphate-dependent enzyme [Meiothermus sp.]|nr:aminotransferase class I/II-fold pyridoxal phosphate-dependent enzyme [Meiothermus sp.]
MKRGFALTETQLALQDDVIECCTPGHRMGKGFTLLEQALWFEPNLPKGYLQMLDDFEKVGRYDHSMSVLELGSLFARDPETALGRTQDYLAQTYGVKFAWPSTNGTSILNIMALMCCTDPGDKVLLQRDSHVSVYSAIIHQGLVPVYLEPNYAKDLGIPLGMTVDRLEKALNAHPDIKAVFLTYPNYYGIATDIAACGRFLEGRGVRLIVDSAHGAYYRFHPELPLSAEQTSAAIVTQSQHKTCSTLSQGSLALFNDTSLEAPFYEWVNLGGFVSTSFSFIILQSLVLGVLQLEKQGRQLIGQAMEACDWARAELNATRGLSCFGIECQRPGFFALDPLRLTVDVSGLGLSGFEVADLLAEKFQIYVELATFQNVLLMFTFVDDARVVRRVVKALQLIAESADGHFKQPRLELPPLPPMRHRPRAAMHHRPRKTLALEEAIGHVSAETISAYPPGSAVIVGGEEITRECVEFLQAVRRQGGILKGASDRNFEHIQILE